MSTKAIANGANEAEQRAAKDANEVQDGVQPHRHRRGFSSALHGHERQRRLRRQSQQPSRFPCLRQQAERPLPPDEWA